MLDLSAITTTGIIAKNSINYLQHAFHILNQGLAFTSLRDANDSERINEACVKQVIHPATINGWYSPPVITMQDQSTAQIAFTSGTEGKAKAIILSAKNLQNTTSRLVEVMQMDASIKEYIGVPVHFSFGFGRVRAISAVKGQCFIPAHGFDLLEFIVLLERNEVNAISLVPSLCRILIQSRTLLESHADKIKWMEIGSQTLSIDDKSALKAMFPQAIIVQHYGLTEASRSTFLSLHQIAEQFLDSVGRAENGVAVQLSSDNAIMIKGDHVAEYILKDGIRHYQLDENGWLCTKDQGELKDGHLFFKGRTDDLINCAGIKISPEWLEGKLLNHFKITQGLAVLKYAHEERGESVMIAHQANLTSLDETTITQAANQILQLANIQIGNSLKVSVVKSIPYTPTGKVQRKLLSEHIDAEQPRTPDNCLYDRNQVDKRSELSIDNICRVWGEVLKTKNVDRNVGFFDLGGDSLGAIILVLKMESLGLEKSITRAILQGKSINQIADMAGLEINNTNNALLEKDKLSALWMSVLKTKQLAQDRSFFDLGGDSLGAIILAIKLEQSGFSKNISKAVMQGKTLDQISNLLKQSQPDITDEAHLAEPIAKSCDSYNSDNIANDSHTSNNLTTIQIRDSINFTKGIVIIMVVLSHWLPNLLWLLNIPNDIYAKYVASLFYFGSPSIALLLGISIGALGISRYQDTSFNLIDSIRVNCGVILIGLTMMAVVLNFQAYLYQEPYFFFIASNSPFMALFSYLYIFAFVPLFLSRLNLAKAKTHVLIAALICGGLTFLLPQCFDLLQRETLTENLIYHFLIGKWNFSKLLCLVFIGIWTGLTIKSYINEPSLLSKLSITALSILLLGTTLSLVNNEYNIFDFWANNLNILGWLFFISVDLVLLITAMHHYQQNKSVKIIKRIFDIVSSLGILLFPIYVLHLLVFPSIYVLNAIGLSYSTSFVLSFLLFGTIGFTLFHRIYHYYYGFRAHE